MFYVAFDSLSLALSLSLSLSLFAGIDYDEAILLTAIRFENACNPVLRANAQATLER